MKRQKIPKSLFPPDPENKLGALEKTDLDGKALMELAHQWYLCAQACQKMGVSLEKRGKAKLYPPDGTLYSINANDSVTESELDDV